MISRNKRFISILLAIAFLLLVPFIAMQFTNEVNWSPTDFAAAGVLLLGTGFICELVLRTVKRSRYRIMICIAVLLICLLVWLELAVGIFGSTLTGH